MRSKEEIREMISAGRAVLGMELGSTRIKEVLIDEDKSPVASGSYDWENQYVDHIWTYDIDEVWRGVQGCYADLVKNVQEEYGVRLNGLCLSVPGEIRSLERRRRSFQNCLPIIFPSAGALPICIRRS